MEKYHYLNAKAPYSLDSLMPLEITDDMYAMNMAFVERYGINNLPEDWKKSQGIYILFSHLQPGYRFEAYVGQTLTGFHQRLVRHDKERDFWDVAILARRTTSLGFNSLQLNSIEGSLRDILQQSSNVHVHNGYPTGDKTMRSSDAGLVDEITLSIMRVMFMRGYRNQHMGAEADRLQNSILSTPSTSISPRFARLPTLPPKPPFPPAVPTVAVVDNDSVDSTVDNASTDSTDSEPTPEKISTLLESETLDPAYLVDFANSVNAKYEEIKAWRREQAIVEERSRQPYLVFSDKTLQNIVLASPKTHEDLLAIDGIGIMKISNYGDAILKIMEE